jgi:hypothetical protein
MALEETQLPGAWQVDVPVDGTQHCGRPTSFPLGVSAPQSWFPASSVEL